ncbi:MAG: capsular biosynthesis protein [Flavobacteriales bacterium]|nr:capsular biosynthesis protein [Bacteroidota bacterium]MCB9239879.1 capsular biosynthesis protein [Flavobacteriales bacterium]
MGLASLFRRKPRLSEEPDRTITVDFHSHLLPGIDDGAKTVEDSIELIRELQYQGIKKIITTPHILGDLYPNNPETIRAAEAKVQSRLKEEGIDMEFHPAAEYYLDEYFLSLLERGDELMLFDDKTILIETNYVEKPEYLEQTIFDMTIDGYTVILAHPERYHYLIGQHKRIEKLFDTGVKFQVNLISFTGKYSPQIKQTADFIANNEMIHYLGSDIHHMGHARLITEFKRSERYQELMELPIMNNSLTA